MWCSANRWNLVAKIAFNLIPMLKSNTIFFFFSYTFARFCSSIFCHLSNEMGWIGFSVWYRFTWKFQNRNIFCFAFNCNKVIEKKNRCYARFFFRFSLFQFENIQYYVKRVVINISRFHKYAHLRPKIWQMP